MITSVEKQKFHSDHDWYKLITEDHYKNQMFPHIFPADFQEEIGFGIFSDTTEVPCYFNVKSRYDYTMITIIHPDMITEHVVDPVRVSQGQTSNHKSKIKDKFTIKPKLAEELSTMSDFKEYVDLNNNTVNFRLLFKYLLVSMKKWKS
eukprot:NODE_1_length_95616_cov_0.657642.p66 type:complete len:148 gc:universal NODE_1_length_95616_cov_0.657642:10562-11005(+)